jgi:methyl-accepting chemotaxis protein
MLSLLGKITIRTKVLVAFACVLFTTLALGAFSIQRLGAVNDEAVEVRDNWLPSTAALARIVQTSEHSLSTAAATVMVDSGAPFAKEEAGLKTVLETAEAARRTYEPMISPGEERRLADEIARDWDAYRTSIPKLLALGKEDKDKEATALYLDEVRPAFQKFRTALQADVEYNVAHGVAAANLGNAAYQSAWTMIVIALAIAAFLCVVAGFLIIASVSRPILRMTAAMDKLAGGDKSVEIPSRDNKDEIGSMAQAVDVFRQNMIRADELALAQRAEQEQKAQRQVAIEQHIATFEGSVRSSLDALASAATEMRATSQGMSATAEETSAQATTVAAAAEQASVNVQTVASATEELSSSVAEIGRQVTQSSKIAGQAVDEAGRTNATVQGMSAAAQKIGDVVKLISDIASQTNLLALNATIEAARAGDAGKGFAVVASEVKSLANQTAKATEEIAAQVAAMQGATGDAVQAIESIGGTIGTINEIASTIASAVEEQGAATQEIARNVQEAAQGTNQVSSIIAGVNQAAGETGAAASQVLASAEELGRQAETLRADVDGFLAKIRAA